MEKKYLVSTYENVVFKYEPKTGYVFITQHGMDVKIEKSVWRSSNKDKKYYPTIKLIDKKGNNIRLSLAKVILVNAPEVFKIIPEYKYIGYRNGNMFDLKADNICWCKIKHIKENNFPSLEESLLDLSFLEENNTKEELEQEVTEDITEDLKDETSVELEDNTEDNENPTSDVNDLINNEVTPDLTEKAEETDEYKNQDIPKVDVSFNPNILNVEEDIKNKKSTMSKIIPYAVAIVAVLIIAAGMYIGF